MRVKVGAVVIMLLITFVVHASADCHNMHSSFPPGTAKLGEISKEKWVVQGRSPVQHTSEAPVVGDEENIKPHYHNSNAPCPSLFETLAHHLHLSA